MKILHVGKYYFPYHGGIETVVRSLAEGFVDRGDEVTVLCSHPGTGGPIDEWIHGVRVVRTPTLGTLASQPVSPLLPVSIERLARSHDVVHVHSPNPLAEACVLPLRKKIPVVVSYHSDVVRQRRFVPIYRPILRRFLARAGRIAVPTRHHVDSSEFLPEFSPKCRVIPFGIDPRELEPRRGEIATVAALRQRYGDYALFVGRLVEYKGLPVLLRAAKSLDQSVVIVGEGPALDDLRSLAGELGISERVHFAGRVGDRATLGAYYRASRCVVLPSISRAEAFGMTLLEAMACGRPLVSSRLDTGVSEVNEDGVTGLQVAPSDPEALATALRRILSDEALASRFGEAGLARFRERYSRAAMISSYRALYAETIES